MTGNPIDLRRRKFLLTAGIGGAGTVAAVTTGALLRQSLPAEPAATAPRAASGYQDTAHVRNYYRTARV